MDNPTSYLDNTLEREGKKLISAQIPVTAGRLKTAEYAYNEDGLRLSKVYDGTTTEYYYNGSVLIGMKIGTGSTAKFLRFSYDASGNVVAVDYSTDNGSSFTTYYYLRNAQNDIVKIIDSTGAAVVEYTYDSWGKVISSTGTLTTTLGTDQPFRYRGYVYDTETGFYYLQSRYYDPATCRFISADVLLSTGQGVLGHNSFAYCLNNPVNGSDDDGMFYRPPRIWAETYTDTTTESPDEWKKYLYSCVVEKGIVYISGTYSRPNGLVYRLDIDNYDDHYRIEIFWQDEPNGPLSYKGGYEGIYPTYNAEWLKNLSYITAGLGLSCSAFADSVPETITIPVPYLGQVNIPARGIVKVGGHVMTGVSIACQFIYDLLNQG